MPSSRPRPDNRANLPNAARKKSPRGNRLSHRALLQRREQCIATLKRLDADRGTNSFFAKAMILLTRYWAGAPWNGRAGLLQTADWLIRVGSHESAPANSHAPRTGG